jgi:hypothetical protein
MPAGTEIPVAFVSRRLNAAERNYEMLEKESSSMVFAVKRLYRGNEFVLNTEHKPLVSMLGSDQPIQPLTASRMQR